MKKFYFGLFVLCTSLLFSQKKIAFVGQAAVYNSAIPSASDGLTYDDDRAAAVWFFDSFLPAHASAVAGTYFSFQEVSEGADLSSFDVLWIQSDGATYTERLNEWPRGTVENNGDKHCVLSEAGFQWNGQCDAMEDAFMASIRNFYQSGKHILLGNFAGKALEVIGVFDGLSNPWEYRPNQTFGDTVANPANTAAAWGTNWAANATPEFISGISITPVLCSFSGQYIEFLGADTEKKNRACQYNLNWGRIAEDAGGDSSTIEQRRAAFTNTLNAEILLENCDGNEIQGARFNPRTEGKGTVVWYGAGVYDWYAPGTGGNEPVKKLTENTLLYLAGLQRNLSVAVHNTEPKISIYPNPAISVLHVHTPQQVETEIYDFSGAKILTSTLKVIPVEKLKTGVYSAVITNLKTQQKTFLKFVKK